jgi:AhpD family alkylhydroperoxidase
MTTFPIHTIETAPEGSKPILEGLHKKMGFVPNLFGAMAEAPAAAEAYAAISGIFEKTSFSNSEKQVVLLSASYVNGCDYCMAAHTTIGTMAGVPEDILGALRDGTALRDAKLDALAALTRSVVETRGWPAEAATGAFYAAGYNQSQYLELLVGVSLKTLSNYINHTTETPLDAAFEPAKWAA